MDSTTRGRTRSCDAVTRGAARPDRRVGGSRVPSPSLPGPPTCRVLAVSTLVLIFVGGLVTSTGSGLSVPDGRFLRMVSRRWGRRVYEHGNAWGQRGGLPPLVLASGPPARKAGRPAAVAWARCRGHRAGRCWAGSPCLPPATPISVTHAAGQVFLHDDRLAYAPRANGSRRGPWRRCGRRALRGHGGDRRHLRPARPGRGDAAHRGRARRADFRDVRTLASPLGLLDQARWSSTRPSRGGARRPRPALRWRCGPAARATPASPPRPAGPGPGAAPGSRWARPPSSPARP